MSSILPKSTIRDLSRHAGMHSTDVPARYVTESVLKTILTIAAPALARIARTKRPHSKGVHIMEADVLDYLDEIGFPRPLTTTGGKSVKHTAMSDD